MLLYHSVQEEAEAQEAEGIFSRSPSITVGQSRRPLTAYMNAFGPLHLRGARADAHGTQS